MQLEYKTNHVLSIICFYIFVVSESCALGDQPGIAFINKTCDELINELPQYCYKEKVRARCCSSCSKHYSWVAGRLNFLFILLTFYFLIIILICKRKKCHHLSTKYSVQFVNIVLFLCRYVWFMMTVVCDVVGCEYGDRVLGCKEFHCNMVNDPSVLTDCCNTCSYGALIPTTPSLDFSVRPFTTEEPTRHRPATCVDSADINGQSCQRYIAEQGRHSCYNTRLSAYCCQSCRAVLSVQIPGQY